MPNSPVPHNEADLIVWLPAFATKLAQHAAALEIAPADVADVKKDCDALTYELKDRVPLLRSYLASAIAYKDALGDGPLNAPINPPVPPTIPAAPATVPAGILIRLRRIVQQIKKHKNYSESIGADLGIIATSGAAKPTAPILLLDKAIAGNVVIRWHKLGWQGIKVQSRVPAAAEWTDLGIDMFSPFVDTRPLDVPGKALTLEYRACYISGDQPTLQWSNVLVVTVSPS